jgi:hypothetical protein
VLGPRLIKFWKLDEGAFFNQDAVDRLIFRGYEDEEEERYQEIYAEWEADLDIKKAKTPE